MGNVVYDELVLPEGVTAKDKGNNTTVFEASPFERGNGSTIGNSIRRLLYNSIEAAKDINASVLFPIHWGTFALSYHDWFEPINLTVEYSEAAGIDYVTPQLGETITFGEEYVNESWWKEIEENYSDN